MGPEVPTADERRTRIHEMLVQASAAHEQYASIYLKRTDPQWANWQAGFMLERNLGKLMSTPMSQEQLGRLLAQLAAEYEPNGMETGQVDFLAQRLFEALQ